MKNLSDNTLGNPICKMPASKIKMSVRRPKYSLLIGATLLAGLLPFPANAQLSQETLNLSSEQNEIDQLQLFPADEGIIPLSQETLNLLSEQEQIAQQQLFIQNGGGEISLIEPDENSLVKPVDLCLAFDSSDSFASKGSCGGVTLSPAAIDTYTARQVSPSRCTYYTENYGCYAIVGQGGRNSSFATAYGPWGPTASALNAQESNPLFFPNGNPVGIWLEANHRLPLLGNDRRAFNEFAVGAAKVMNDWRSPVFFDISLGPVNNAIAVLESITFNINGASNLGQLCNSYGFNNKGANVGSVASNCSFPYGDANNYGFNVSSIDIAYWPDGISGSNRVDRTYSGSNLSSFILNNFNKKVTTTYVWDPPQTTEKVPEPSSTLGLLTFGLFSVGSFFGRKRK